jgi:rSAM/selenodomain-associated transferase 2
MISVIIPTYNEISSLSSALEAVKANSGRREVLVIDAASEDGTLEVAAAHGGQFLVCPRRQRAAQMNLGAQHARGETLIFLHADTLLPASAFTKIDEALRNPAVAGGAFARKFQSPSFFLYFTSRLAELRSRCLGWFLGDQAIFVRRRVFERMGGYRDFDLFEDLDFARRLRVQGRVVTLRPQVVSSGRRFDRRGPFRTSLADFSLTVRYLGGADPNTLARTLQPPPA